MIDRALAGVGHLLLWLLALVISVFAFVEGAVRALLHRLGVAPQLQTAIMLIVTVLLLVAVVRAVGGVFRVLLLVFLALLLLHMLLPGMLPTTTA